MEKYEVEFVHSEPWPSQAMISMLTGYPLEEILALTGKKKGLPSREFIRCFRALGYNCSPRFVPFQADTPYPVLLRALGPTPAKRTSPRTGKLVAPAPDWYAAVYYDQVVYEPYWEDGIFPLKVYDQVFPDLRITSMIQVWVSDGPESITRTNQFY